MFKSDNLSGLTNVPLARSNLGIFNATSTQIGIIQLATYSDISATGSLIKSTAPKHVYDAIQEFATIPLTSVISALDEVTFKVDNKFNEFGSNETSKALARFNLGISDAAIANKGLIEIAPNSSIVDYPTAGTHTDNSVTPALLALALPNLIAKESSGIGGDVGYIRLPNDLTLQWTKVPMSSKSYPVSVTLPVPIDTLSMILPSYTRDLTNPSSISAVTSYTHTTIVSGGKIIGFNQVVGFPGAGGTITYPSSTGTGYGHTWFFVIGKINP